MTSEANCRSPFLYVVAKSSLPQPSRRFAAYAIVADARSGIREHWGFGREDDAAVMVVHAMIRILGSLDAADPRPQIRVATNYNNTLISRIGSTVDTMAKRDKGEKIEPKNREPLWLELAPLSALHGVGYSWKAQELDAQLMKRALKLAQCKAADAARGEKMIQGLHETDNWPLDWLEGFVAGRCMTST